MDNIKSVSKKELIEKITQKKEFSKLPEKDVELAFEKFDKKDLNDYQKLKLVRQFLRKIYSSFTSRKLLNVKDMEVDYVLGKHKSTKERVPFYEEVYEKIFEGLNTQGCTTARVARTCKQAPTRRENLLKQAPNNIQKNILTRGISVIDLGAGVNGFSYEFFRNNKLNYVGVEAVGQLVDLTNYFFKKKKINGEAFHLSLFEVDKIKDLIKKQKKPKVVFLFKVIDSLEVVERDYSKKLLEEIVPLVDKVVLSFATKSLGRRSKFSAQRGWIKRFIEENFEVLDDFELGGERYFIFQKKTL